MANNEFDGAHVIIKVDNLISSTRDKPNYLSFYGELYEKETIDLPLICKIESTGISNEDKKDYEPSILSIGPYHNGKPSTKATQTIKYECLNYILKMNENKKLEDYMKAIKEMENQIRSCYRDEIEMDRNSFLKMLLLDGCFIILILHGAKQILPPRTEMQSKSIKMITYENMGECIINMEELELHESQQNIQSKQEDVVNEADHYRTRMWDFDLFMRDMLLSENQIPFFVITKIYEIAMGGNNETSLLTEIIVKSIEDTVDSYTKSLIALDRPKKFHHLLHLCHMFFKPSKTYLMRCKSIYRGSESCRWHRATEYIKAGISFVKKEFSSDNPHSLLDIEFCNGTLEIPCLNFDDYTSCLFRNLIAFEQTYPQVGNHVSEFVIFWSKFISEPDDAALLTKKGIIVHQLNSDAEVSDIFKTLSEGIVPLNDDSYLNSTYHNLEEHYETNKSGLKTLLGKSVSKFSRALSLFHPTL